MAEAGTALSMRVTEAVSEFRLRRVVLGRSMNDLQSRVHANARNRRRNRGMNAEASASVRVGTRRRSRDTALLDTSAVHPPLPPGWAMVWCPQGRPYYWNYIDGSAQWELPAGVQSGAPHARPQCDRIGEASLGNGPDEGPPASSELGSESSARPTFRIRFASAHGMAQVAQASPIAWEPEPMPRARERDSAYGPGQKS